MAKKKITIRVEVFNDEWKYEEILLQLKKEGWNVKWPKQYLGVKNFNMTYIADLVREF